MTSMFLGRASVIVLIVGALTFSDALAQDGLRGFDQERVFARPGQPTHQVLVWGQVSQPGMWRVERDTDLLEFLTVLQVPGVGRDEAGYRQHFTVRVYRQEGGNRSEIFTQRLDRMLEGQPEYPVLQENDIVAVEARRRRALGLETMRVGLQVISTAVSLILLYERF